MHTSSTLLVLALCAGCAPRPPAGSAAGADTVLRLHDAAGTVKRVGTMGYGIVPDSDPGTRYAPDHLPAEFEVDGLRVVFSGDVQTPPPGARVWGTSLRLTAIRRAEPAPP